MSRSDTTSSRRARRALLWALAALASILVFAPAAAAACPKTTLAELEDRVMCPVCGTSLGVANGPQAERERAFIRREIAACKSADQIEAALVGEFGPNVLATPRKSGFAVAAWAVPILALAVGAAVVALLIRRWRRASRAESDERSTEPDADELARVEHELELHG